MDIKNLAVIRQSFANTVFTHKIQEMAAKFKSTKSFLVKIANIILTALVLIILLLQAFYPQKLWFSYVGAGITLAEIIFLIIQLSFNFEEGVSNHKDSALKYMALRDRYRHLIADIMNDGIDGDNLRNRRDKLQDEYQMISEFSPQTGDKEYQEAQKRLNKRGVIQAEEFTWSDEEIDHFLPEELRLKKHES